MSSPVFPSWVNHPELVDFYSQHRNSPADLYPSERRFLPWLARQSVSVLDTGCAAGGFSQIWQAYNPGIDYTGIDISAPLIEAAQQLHPDLQFHCANLVTGIDLPSGYATVVQALGWLNWEPDYGVAIAELWRLTERYLFLDVRLVTTPDAVAIGQQQLAFSGTWDGTTTTPYVTVLWPTFAEQLLALNPQQILGYGYWGQPATSVMGITSQVCFAAFVLEKTPLCNPDRVPTLCLDLPLSWPTALRDRVEDLPTAHLETLVQSNPA
ncbi:hypothetical protein DO97_11000 [Neosynechococcus sphagnicola sy1]|uniref:Methyltransferase type 11 domain-containing protein n=1 Tax=Neosynechococcus sphagnicola sy1 TaxID=1497020 RepID=A0A098TJF3_9CYAN|nr:class I SAM-dependent methyltransferase [Neosynechococcus sphagnicola]KGF72269.1 hypothetical protein DO97_11000 [Neosynechococcus sphagnicola sy1]